MSRDGTPAETRIMLCYVITRTSPNPDKEPIVNLTLQVIPTRETFSLDMGTVRPDWDWSGATARDTRGQLYSCLKPRVTSYDIGCVYEDESART
ncbi:hypothetical protein KPH14_008323 [Odynerus spinipes]|uniref:Uncharacterized protein n=1 Tax=Odynerus spinipes TaxID=1348599 RepID=A0AAD9R905_9HYME|nr:hypothetical protein KPH14_008323 [Odynerus spinipes]